MAPPAAIIDEMSTFDPPADLTIGGIAKRRAAEGKLIAGVAALADVEAFKGRLHHIHKPRAKRWDRELFRLEVSRMLMHAQIVCRWSPEVVSKALLKPLPNF